MKFFARTLTIALATLTLTNCGTSSKGIESQTEGRRCSVYKGFRFDYTIGFGSQAEAADTAAIYGNKDNKDLIVSGIPQVDAANQCDQCGFLTLGAQTYNFLSIPKITSEVGDTILSAGWWGVRVSGYCKAYNIRH